MTTTLTLDVPLALRARAVAEDLHELVFGLSNPETTEEWREALADRLRELSERCASLGDALSGRQRALVRSLTEVSENLRTYAHDAANTGARWHAESGAWVGDARATLSRNYEEILVHLRKARLPGKEQSAASLPHLKPTNYARTGFHVVSGVVGFLLYWLVLSQEMALGVLFVFFAAFLFMEVTRRMSNTWNDILVDKVFGAIARPWERHGTNSATWYLLALILIVLLTPKAATLIGVLVLSLGDPAASVIGRRYGKRKIWKQKSLAGALGFFGAAFLATLLVCRVAVDGHTWLASIGVSVAVGVVGALAELFSDRVEDNFSVPVLTAGVAALLL